MKLSIVIVSWNTKQLLADCLQSLLPIYTSLNQVQPTIEVIVVDNASHDDTAAAISQDFPWVQLIASDKNLGFPGGNNKGIDASSGEYILLLNPDTIVHGRAIETLIDFLDHHPQVGAAGARLLNGDGSLQESCYPRPTLSRELWRLLHLDRLYPYGVYKMGSWSQQEPREVEVLLGACILVRRAVLMQVGVMDEAYFMYSEEVDLCYRIQQGGWSLYWVPTAAITHYGGQSTQLVKEQMFLRLYESKLLYFKKNHGRSAAQMYKTILFIASLFRLSLTPLIYLQQRSQRERHLWLAALYWQLLVSLPRM